MKEMLRKFLTEITKGLEIKFVTHMNEVLKEALV